jgi:hypothetical protein
MSFVLVPVRTSDPATIADELGSATRRAPIKGI